MSHLLRPLALLFVVTGCSGAVQNLGLDGTNEGGPDGASGASTATCSGGTGCGLAVGESSACAITAAGGVRCWGDNSFGQLGSAAVGDGGSDESIEVGGLVAPTVQLTAGNFFMCALSGTGIVQCWGDNGDGELGTQGASVGSCSCSPAPASIASLPPGVAGIGAGQLSVYAIVPGGVEAWGDNGSGSLGNSSGGGAVPVPVKGLSATVTAVRGGLDDGCVLTKEGAVMCWGWAEHGELGNGTTADSAVAVNVTGLASGVQAIAAGDSHTCALLTSGGVSCWGANSYGQLGNGSTTESTTPVSVAGLTGIKAIAAGGFSTCALTAAGGVSCWGDLASKGAPTNVPGLASGVAAIAVGLSQVCAKMASGGVKCWTGSVADATDVVGFP